MRAYGTLSGQDCWARWSFLGDIALTLSVNLKICGFTYGLPTRGSPYSHRGLSWRGSEDDALLKANGSNVNSSRTS